ncbi:hypothetical protein EU527_19565 [Candidatus Thorarchaeota archaeon]|nr:MAG: hypothetical protein EU527_19565 [Candidatus Thorarchaeota archaeon]
MRGKGVVLSLLILVIVCQLPVQVEAGRSEQTLYWQCGLRIRVQVENNDFWTTDSVSEIYFILTLLDRGNITEIQALIFEITVVTETNYTGQITVNNPWSAVGDETRLVGKFSIDKEDVNNAGWDIYMASFHYNFSLFVEFEGGEEMRLYTHVYDGTPLSISTFSFIVFWPFPPIILMGTIYWVLYFGLRRFNRRYEGLESDSRTSLPNSK